jgi:hypothetical protein
MIKKLSLLCALLAAACIGRTTTHWAAYDPAPAYVCGFGPGGNNSTSPCTQYIVEVSTARLGGGAIIYQVTESPFAVDGANIRLVAASQISDTHTQQPLPNNNGDTFTIAISKP